MDAISCSPFLGGIAKSIITEILQFVVEEQIYINTNEEFQKVRNCEVSWKTLSSFFMIGSDVDQQLIYLALEESKLPIVPRLERSTTGQYEKFLAMF